MWSDFETDSETSAEVRNCLSKFCLLLLKLLFNWIMTDFFCKCRLDCLLFWLPLLVHNWNLFWRILVHNCKKFCYFTLQYHGLKKLYKVAILTENTIVWTYCIKTIFLWMRNITCFCHIIAIVKSLKPFAWAFQETEKAKKSTL